MRHPSHAARMVLMLRSNFADRMIRAGLHSRADVAEEVAAVQDAMSALADKLGDAPCGR